MRGARSLLLASWLCAGTAAAQYGGSTASPPVQPPPGQTQPAAPPPQPQPAPATAPPTGGGSQPGVASPRPVAPPSSPATAATVNPSADPGYRQPAPPVVIQRESPRPPLETVAVGAGFGGLAGALVGTGVALIERDNWWRDLSVGAGAGILVGAVVGGVQAATRSSDRIASDGLRTPDREPPLASAPTLLSYSGRF